MNERKCTNGSETPKVADLDVGDSSARSFNLVCESEKLGVQSPRGDLTDEGLACERVAAPQAFVGSAGNSESPPELGERYQVLSILGSGGMATVWKVHDSALNEDFAVKVLRAGFLTDETAIRRFERESQLASELTHANIAATFCAGFDEQQRPYIIMRYVDGESLADILAREGTLPEERAVDICVQVCEALSHAHMKGIVHRDVKPSNILISKTDSGADLVQLVDFGIAHCIYDELTKTQSLTRVGDICGSPRYMSPEQLLGAEVTHQSDMYSLGCVFFEMLTSKPPFTEENPVKLIVQQIGEAPDLKLLPYKYRAVMSCCLAKDASIRPANVGLLVRYLELANTRHQHNPDWVKLAPTISIVLIIISVVLLPQRLLLTALFVALIWANFGLINCNYNTANNDYRRLELSLLVLAAVLLPLSIVELCFPHVLNISSLFVICLTALFSGLAVWLTASDRALASYVGLEKRLRSFKLGVFIFDGGVKKVLSGAVDLLICFAIVVGAYRSVAVATQIMAGLSAGIPLWDEVSSNQNYINLLVFLGLIVSVAYGAFGSAFSDRGLKQSLFHGFRCSAAAGCVGLAAGVLSAVLLSPPGTMDKLAQLEVDSAARNNFDAYKHARESALKYPDLLLSNQAKLLAARGLSEKDGNDEASLVLCDQIIDGQNSPPELKAKALDWKIYVIGEKSDYKSVVAPLIDETFTQLEKVDESLVRRSQGSSTFGEIGGPGYVALALAKDATASKDAARAERGIAIARRFAANDFRLLRSIEFFQYSVESKGKVVKTVWNRYY